MDSKLRNAINLLLHRKIDDFRSAFKKNSRDLFTTDNGVLYQPAEFGAYRENLVRKFLENILPERMAIGSGFVINSNGNNSTQCDIIIYDKTVTPLIKDENNNKFFPVESVVAVGEVKSTLNLSQLKESLTKLAKVKSFRDSLYLPSYIYSLRNKVLPDEYKPETDELDQIITFIVCEKFDFSIGKIRITDIVCCYNESKPKRPFCHRHNMVLSLDDGLLTYVTDQGGIYPFPSKLIDYIDLDEKGNIVKHIPKPKLLNYRFIKPMKDDSIEHIRHFTSFLHTALVSVSVLFPDLGKYIPDEEDVRFFDCEQTYKF
ncbi:DUF6602 domain-containing protein [Acinetobacter baumannii]|uniref:DUF6602 domain-containing protein n=1 Tax=Acinetobacter baumannii TaxID=470 RepID=UPI003A878FF3